MAKAARAATGRSSAHHVFFLNDNDVFQPALCELIGNAEANNSSADDDYFCGVFHHNDQTKQRSGTLKGLSMRPRFIADVMVGKLARWLRILGHDVSYSNQYEDDDIVRIAAEEDRIILTRDVRLLERKAVVKGLRIESGDYRDQVRQVLR